MNSLFNTILSKKTIHEVFVILLIVRKEIVQTNCTWIEASQQEEETTRRKLLIVISQYFLIIFLLLEKTQDDVALATCMTQYTWVQQLVEPKVMWIWQYARPNTFGFTNKLNSRQHGLDEMSNPRHLSLTISWVQDNMSLVKCQTQEAWVQQSAEEPKATKAWWNAILKKLGFNNQLNPR